MTRSVVHFDLGRSSADPLRSMPGQRSQVVLVRLQVQEAPTPQRKAARISLDVGCIHPGVVEVGIGGELNSFEQGIPHGEFQSVCLVAGSIGITGYENLFASKHLGELVGRNYIRSLFIISRNQKIIPLGQYILIGKFYRLCELWDEVRISSP